MAGEESSPASLQQWIGGEQGLVTLVLTDIVRATLLLYGDRSAAYIQVIHAHRRRARALIDALRGRVVDMSGDGVFAIFRAADDAFRFGAALVEGSGDEKVRVRAGIHHGRVHANADGLFGRAVHFAARVMECGGASEIWVSDAAKQALEEQAPERAGAMGWQEQEARELEGVPGSHRL